MTPEANTACASCTMPIESGTLCVHCADEDGNLRPFEELFERMVQWTLSHERGLAREAAEAKTLAFMAERPAWRDHPDVKARLEGS